MLRAVLIAVATIFLATGVPTSAEAKPRPTASKKVSKKKTSVKKRTAKRSAKKSTKRKSSKKKRRKAETTEPRRPLP